MKHIIGMAMTRHNWHYIRNHIQYHFHPFFPKQNPSKGILWVIYKMWIKEHMAFFLWANLFWMNYIIVARELLSHHPDNIGTLMTHTVYNELSTSRNPNNMALITVMFQHSSERAAKVSIQVAASAARFTKRSYMYELKHLVNPYEAMLANIWETRIYEPICKIWARPALVKRAPGQWCWFFQELVGRNYATVENILTHILDYPCYSPNVYLW